jgi:hypothetical protein
MSTKPTSLWECGDCSQPETRTRRVDAVCHHCGIPLCREHQRRLLDPAFSGALIGKGLWAVHCADCRTRHHLLLWPSRAGQP